MRTASTSSTSSFVRLRSTTSSWRRPVAPSKARPRRRRPKDAILAFALAVPFIQGALFSTMNAGTDLARDIDTGFINRLSLTALRDWALLSGQLAGVVALGVVQALFYVAVGIATGVEFESGVLGIAVLLFYAAIVSLSFGALGAFLAFRTGSGEAIQ